MQYFKWRFLHAQRELEVVLRICFRSIHKFSIFEPKKQKLQKKSSKKNSKRHHDFFSKSDFQKNRIDFFFKLPPGDFLALKELDNAFGSSESIISEKWGLHTGQSDKNDLTRVEILAAIPPCYWQADGFFWIWLRPAKYVQKILIRKITQFRDILRWARSYSSLSISERRASSILRRQWLWACDSPYDCAQRSMNTKKLLELWFSFRLPRPL